MIETSLIPSGKLWVICFVYAGTRDQSAVAS